MWAVREKVAPAVVDVFGYCDLIHDVSPQKKKLVLDRIFAPCAYDSEARNARYALWTLLNFEFSRT
jgi:hypothetical protein